MTIDEAIKHCLDIADGQDKCAEISVSEHAKERISQCAADHRQLAEWLKELKSARTDIYNLLTKAYTSNCRLCKYRDDENADCYTVGGEWCKKFAEYKPFAKQ